MMRTALACVAVLAIACDPVPPPAKPKPSAFSCSGGPAPPAIVQTPVPTGRVEVRSLGDGPDGPRLRVLAENAPASEVAIRIGEALGATTRIDPDLDKISVSLFVPDVTVDLLGALLRTSRVRLSKADWQKEHVLVFGIALPNLGDVGAVEMQFAPPSKTLSPEQVASLFCRSAASYVGWAQVAGNQVILGDRRNHLDEFATILERVDEAAQRKH